MPSLSVVLISKNQDWNISRLIESVLKETAGGADIVLVDSASTDSTISTAAHYPIRILRLKPDQRLTAAAGRWVGYEHSESDLILFLDGDMELYPGWLMKGVEILESDDTAAAVTGVLLNRPMHGHDASSTIWSERVGDITQVKHGGGAALYRRSVLKQVGTFNPALYSDEEPELCIRIRCAGYRILKTEYPIAYHYSDPDDALTTLMARRRRRLYLGAGQNLRYHLGTSTFLPYLRERGFGCAPAISLGVATFALLIGMVAHQWYWLGAILVLALLIFVIDALRKHSLYLACFSLLKRLLIADGTVRGFFLPQNETPIQFDVIRDVEPISVVSGVGHERSDS